MHLWRQRRKRTPKSHAMCWYQASLLEICQRIGNTYFGSSFAYSFSILFACYLLYSTLHWISPICPPTELCICRMPFESFRRSIDFHKTKSLRSCNKSWNEHILIQKSKYYIVHMYHDVELTEGSMTKMMSKSSATAWLANGKQTTTTTKTMIIFQFVFHFHISHSRTYS